MPANALRKVVCVINNYTEADSAALRAFADEYADYAIASFEIGESGTPHIQAYLSLKRQMRFNAVKDKLPRAHLEPAKGKPQRNKEYCEKGEQPHAEWEAQGIAGPTYGTNANIFFEIGNLSQADQQGKRNDLEAVCQSVCAGKSLREIAEDHPEEYIKFNKGIKDYKATLAQPRSAATEKEIIIHIGPTGTGKTRTAVEANPNAYIMGPEQGKWWDGYDMHTEVILEEYRGQFTFGYLLRLTDRYAMKVEYKGGLTEFVADKIIITSPEHPGLWYSKLEQRDGKMAQLKRRISKILEFKTLGEPPVDITEDPWPVPSPDPSDLPMPDQFF